MILGIDGSNIRGGGTVTHLIELIRHAVPAETGFERVEVWAGAWTLQQIPDRPWLKKRTDPMLDGPLFHRIRWQQSILPLLSRGENYSLVFSPGGTCSNRFHPVVTMSQNMLPFHAREFRRYGLRWMFVRNLLLRFAQAQSFRNSDGIVFLNQHARDSALAVTGPLTGHVAVIPHGIPLRFRALPRLQKPLASYDSRSPFRLLYVSTVDEYKHQWRVAEAVFLLRQKGIPIAIDFAGSTYEPSARRLRAVLNKCDPSGDFMRHHGFVPYDDLPRWYRQADLFVFASSCENQPIALLEAMAAGLPIACSAVRPMTDMLSCDVAWFDPMNSRGIASAIESIIADVDRRTRCAAEVFDSAAAYTWESCASRTFRFLAEIARENHAVCDAKIVTGK